MPISDKAFDRYDRSMRMGLALWAESDKEKKRMKEREGIERRQQQEFDWKKEDRKKKQDYEVFKREFDLGASLIKAGKIREGTATQVNAYNKRWPDGMQAMLAFRSDKPDAESEKKWDRDMKLEGKEIALLFKGMPPVGFQSLEEFQGFVNKGIGPKEYLEDYKASEAEMAELNMKEKPFKAKDGFDYVQTWEMGPGGRPKKGPVVPYKEKVPATKEERMGLRIKEYEKTTGEKLTPSERKELTLGLKPPKKGKTVSLRDTYKKDLDLVLRVFKSKPTDSIFSEEDDLSESGKNALDTALKLVEKAVRDPRSLTESEKKILPHARRAWQMFSKISEMVSSEYEPKREPTGGNDWRQYRAVPTAGVRPSLPTNRSAIPLSR
jgi:hypothetical protein